MNLTLDELIADLQALREKFGKDAPLRMEVTDQFGNGLHCTVLMTQVMNGLDSDPIAFVTSGEVTASVGTGRPYANIMD